MNDYFLVQFAKETEKKTSQLTLSDMLKFNKWKKKKEEFDAIEFPQIKVNEALEETSSSRHSSERKNRFTRTNSPLK